MITDKKVLSIRDYKRKTTREGKCAFPPLKIGCIKAQFIVILYKHNL